MKYPLAPERLKELHASQPKQAALISPEQMRSRIAHTIFTDVAGNNGVVRCITCLIELDNGFQVLGKSFVADPDNFNRELGEHYAYTDAFNQLWGPFAFTLRETKFNPVLSKANNLLLRSKNHLLQAGYNSTADDIGTFLAEQKL